MKINTLKLIFILLLLTGCSEDDNVFGPEEVVDESYQIYDFYLSSDELNYTNGYYEFNMSVSGQALTKLSANTNNPSIYQYVSWDCDTQWEYNWNDGIYLVPIINHYSYSDDEGMAYSMFGPMSDMAIDTVKVWASYTDSYTNHSYSDTISIILLP